MGNPPYNNARGAAALAGMPPFDFDGVVMRVFPLKANMHALSRFCDQYLNLMPPDIAHFRPAAPYVFLNAINYGRMTTEGGNAGWVAQNEVAFSVLLNWYRQENGEPVFVDWASVSPFIFVDQESSLASGREVYGWPKSLAWLTPGINEWARNPRQAQNLFVLSAMVFPELFAGKRQEPRVLFEIQHEPPPELSRVAVDPFSRLSPLQGWPRALAQGLSLAGDLVETMIRPPLAGYGAGPEQDRLPELFSRATETMDVFNRLPVFNTINLKQFRDSRDAAAACYQAITSAPMKVTRSVDGGLLGESHQLTGDPSGGYRLRVHRYPAHPIVESLGLEVVEETAERDHQVATLEPTCPFWVELDLNYGKGQLVCWRTSEIDWQRGSVTTEPGARWGGPAPPTTTPIRHSYNTARGGALQAVTGPFHFPNATVRVLPLLADWTRLRRLCSEYLDTDFTFCEPWGSYVYLITITFEEMSSETYNVGWWANRQVAFSLPVKWFRRSRRGGGDLLGVAMVTPFVYTDSDLGATTGREVQGLPMVKAVIESPPGSWLEDSGPAKRSEMLRLSTGVFSGLGAGQEMEQRLLLEITRRDVLPHHDEAGWRTVAATWGERLFTELYRRGMVRRKRPEEFAACRALALELIRGEGQPFSELSFRQFRDVERPERACYQALTLTQTTVEELFELCEIEEPMHVALHRYPSQPIVETLGLRCKRTDATGSSVVDYLQPVRPFWMRLAMRVDLGEDVLWRADSEAWRPSPRKRHSSLVDERTTQVGVDLVEAIDARQSLQRDLRVAWRLWRFRPRFQDHLLLRRYQARRAIGARPQRPDQVGAPEVIEPQMILESILSNGWGRSRPRTEGRLPEMCVRSDSLGPRRGFERKWRYEEQADYWYIGNLEDEAQRARGQPGTLDWAEAAEDEYRGQAPSFTPSVRDARSGLRVDPGAASEKEGDHE